ncbi:hypothetical protein PISMIDRAFT_680070 [Pisolithus microcarpus 441]|uniref:Unplaced genomic scaffold scaffold_54, whole genome shotgun sequence n=1 Tax=Pisolithus microcarpus 441 TaxID=765257 RepID=A0A0C9ZRX6_9AGAM|nr:hypothetical protein PISMIDRAFT_680070 [Pisolithus microcarpus 441]
MTEVTLCSSRSGYDEDVTAQHHHSGNIPDPITRLHKFRCLSPARGHAQGQG